MYQIDTTNNATNISTVMVYKGEFHSSFALSKIEIATSGFSIEEHNAHVVETIKGIGRITKSKLAIQSTEDGMYSTVTRRYAYGAVVFTVNGSKMHRDFKALVCRAWGADTEGNHPALNAVLAEQLSSSNN